MDFLLLKLPHLETAPQLFVSVRTAQGPTATLIRRLTGGHISLASCLWSIAISHHSVYVMTYRHSSWQTCSHIVLLLCIKTHPVQSESLGHLVFIPSDMWRRQCKAEASWMLKYKMKTNLFLCFKNFLWCTTQRRFKRLTTAKNIFPLSPFTKYN